MACRWKENSNNLSLDTFIKNLQKPTKLLPYLLLHGLYKFITVKKCFYWLMSWLKYIFVFKGSFFQFWMLMAYKLSWSSLVSQMHSWLHSEGANYFFIYRGRDPKIPKIFYTGWLKCTRHSQFHEEELFWELFT